MVCVWSVSEPWNGSDATRFERGFGSRFEANFPNTLPSSRLIEAAESSQETSTEPRGYTYDESASEEGDEIICPLICITLSAEELETDELGAIPQPIQKRAGRMSYVAGTEAKRKIRPVT